MKWTRLSDHLAESEQGHRARKHEAGDMKYYSIFSPTGWHLGSLHGEFSGIGAFLDNPEKPEPQEQGQLYE